MGFPIPNLRSYDLYFYPTYQGGPLVSSRKNKINENSSFTIPKTDFTPSYGVNTAGNTSAANDTNFFTLNNDGSLSSKPINSAPSYSTPLNLDLGNTTGGVKTSTSTATPNSPNRYEDYLKFLSISDYKLSDLLAQPEFKLPGIGLGLKVTTDGLGNVDNVSIDPSVQGTRRSAGPLDPSFALLNRAEINQRAVLNSPAANIARDNQIRNQNANPAAQNLPNRIGVDVPLLFSGLKDTQGLFKLGGPEFEPGRFGLGPERIGAGQSNPFLDRLASLQPPEGGIAVTGADTAITPDTARQLAATNAGLDVSLSPEFKNNLSQLVKYVATHNDAYQAFIRADGTIPMAPSLPMPAKPAAETGQMAFDSNLDMTNGMFDAVDKKGSGAYMPFNTGTFNMGAGGGFDGSQNPFGAQTQSGFTQQGFSQQQQQRPYRPLAFVA